MWTPYAPTPAPLPWWRTTPAIIIGALVCLVVGGIGGVLLVVAGSFAAGGFDPADSRTYGEGGDIAELALRPGQCAVADIDDGSSFGETSAVDCSTVHSTEVFATVEAPDVGGTEGTWARGDLANFGDAACYAAFEPYVDSTYDGSDYDYLPVIPSVAAWDAGARTVHCVLYAYDGDPTSGSAKQSGR